MERNCESPLSEQVDESLMRLCRWTRVIRHDLGNIFYPSAKLVRRINEDAPSDDMRRYMRQVQTLIATVDEARSALQQIRSDPNQPENTDFAAWWASFGRLAGAIIDADTAIELKPSDRPIRCAAGRSDLSLLFMSALIAIDIQIETTPETIVLLEPNSADSDGVVRFRFDFSNVSCDGVVVPESVMERARLIESRVHAGADGYNACWLTIDVPRAD